MRPDIFLATIGRGSNGSNALEVTEDRAAVTAESQDNIINRVNNISQYGPSWHYVPGIGVAGTAYAEVPGSALGDLAFSRASSKTRTNAAGVIETIGNNVPPHDYRNADGSLSTFPRLNLEPQRINSALFSEMFADATWVKTTTTVTANTITAPNGTLTADTLTASGTFPRLVQNPTIAANQTYTISIYAKAGTAAVFSISVTVNSVALVNNVQYNLTTGVVTGAGTMTTAGNGWYRCSATFTVGASIATPDIRFCNHAQGVSGGWSGTNFFYTWGAQFEAGAYPTTYIPTTTAAVTRFRDFCLKGNIGNTSTAGTLFTEFDVTRINSNNGQYLIGMAVGTVDTLGGAYSTVLNSISIIANGPILQGRNNGLSTNLFSLTPSVGNNVKIIMRYNGTNVVAFVNGVKQTIYTDTSVGVKNFIRINNAEESTYNARQLAFFSSELTDAQCIQLTTL